MAVQRRCRTSRRPYYSAPVTPTATTTDDDDAASAREDAREGRRRSRHRLLPTAAAASHRRRRRPNRRLSPRRDLGGACRAGSSVARPDGGGGDARVAERLAARSTARWTSRPAIARGPGCSSASSPPRSWRTSAAWRLLRAGRRRGSRLSRLIACAVQLVPLGAPLLLSTDAWAYWDYGRHRRGSRRESVSRRARRVSEAIRPFAFIGTDWRDSTTVYGPAFTLASEPLAACRRLVRRRCGVDLQVARAPSCDARDCGARRGAAV